MSAGFHEVRFPLAIGIRVERRAGAADGYRAARLRATRSAIRAGRIRAGATMPGRACARSPICTRCSAFFEERRGRLYGFRWRDRADWKSCAPGETPGRGRPGDRDRRRRDGDVPAREDLWRAPSRPISATIAKPVAGTVRVAVDGDEQAEGADFSRRRGDGVVTFLAGQFRRMGAVVTAGFEFDVPVRFDTDRLDINLASFEAGEVPNVPVVEIRV